MTDATETRSMAKTKRTVARRFLSLFGMGNPVSHLNFDEVFPTQDELNEDHEFNRAFAVDMAEDQRELLSSMREITVSLSKWILTTLLAINSGGLLSLSQLELGAGAKVAAGVLFILGVLLTLVSAHISVRSGFALALPAGEIQGYWRAVRHNGYRDRVTEIGHLSLITAAVEASRWPYRLGYASIAAFIGGLASIGYGLLTVAP